LVRRKPTQGQFFGSSATSSYNPLVIQLSSVYLKLKGRQLLAGFDWQLPDPGAYLLLGPTGSGKSLLARLLAGRQKPQQGTVSIDGYPLYRLFGGYNEPTFLAEAEVACREHEPLDLYLAEEMANAGETSKALENVWPVLDRYIPDGRRRPMNELAHGQVLLAQIALACVMPVRLAVLDGHLTYMDSQFCEAAAGLIARCNAEAEKFLVMTSTRLASYFPPVSARYLLSGETPVSISDLSDTVALDAALKPLPVGGAIRIYTREAPTQREGVTSTQYFQVLAVLEDGLRVKLSGGLDDALRELRAQGLSVRRLEWELGD
jgi:ABC-type Mn2+/Zn2+ transport system ATPase subunit